MKFDLNKIAKAAALSVGAVTLLPSANAALVINELYSYGGGVGAIYQSDFIELLNNDTLASISYTAGITVQYASSTGYFGSNTFSLFTTPGFTLLPGQSYLITGSTTSGTVGTAVTGVDYSAGDSFNAAQTSGKLRILDGTTVLDLLGFGAATASPTTPPTAGFSGPGFETAVATSPTATMSITRTLGADTNNNSVDFSRATPSPTGTVTPEPTAVGLAAVASIFAVSRRKR